MWKFIQDEDGATSIEYGLIAALVSVAIIVSLKLLGQPLYGTFKVLTNAVTP